MPSSAEASWFSSRSVPSARGGGFEASQPNRWKNPFARGKYYSGVECFAKVLSYSADTRRRHGKNDRQKDVLPGSPRRLCAGKKSRVSCTACTTPNDALSRLQGGSSVLD